MTDRTQIKEKARETLRNDRGIFIGTFVLYSVLCAAASGLTLGLGTIFLVPPLLIGYTMFNIRAFRGAKPTFETLFVGFSQYSQALVVFWLRALRVFLWMLLLIVPGIVKYYGYYMAPYLAADYPNLTPAGALELSERITKGRRMEIFIMEISFIGWMMLSGLTFGILQFVFVGPYMNLSLAGLYAGFLKDALESGAVQASELQEGGR